MIEPIREPWEQEDDNPAFGFLMAQPPVQFYESEKGHITCNCLANTTGGSGIRPLVLNHLHALIDDIFATGVVVRSVIYQPASVSCFRAVQDLFAVEGDRSQILSDLRRKILGFKSLAQNWDGEGADPISALTVTTALRTIEQIEVVLSRKNASSSPSVRAFPDGSIFFKWVFGNKELALTVYQSAIQVQRWEPIEAVHSLGLWEVPVDEIAEHVEWVLT